MHLATNSLGKIMWCTWCRPWTLLEELREARYDPTQVIPASFPGLDNLTPYSKPKSDVSEPLDKPLAHGELNSEDEVDLILSSNLNQ